MHRRNKRKKLCAEERCETTSDEQSCDVVLTDDALRRILASPRLSLLSLARVAPTCKLFKEEYQARCAADEAWAEAAALTTFGSSLVDLIIQFHLSRDPDVNETRTVCSMVDLVEGEPCPEPASVLAFQTIARATFKIGLEGMEQKSFEGNVNLLRFSPLMKKSLTVCLRHPWRDEYILAADLGMGGEYLEVEFSPWEIVPEHLVPCIGLIMLLMKALAAAGQAGTGLRRMVEGHAPRVSLFVPCCDFAGRRARWRWDNKESRRAVLAFVAVCKRCWPTGDLKLAATKRDDSDDESGSGNSEEEGTYYYW